MCLPVASNGSLGTPAWNRHRIRSMITSSQAMSSDETRTRLPPDDWDATRAGASNKSCRMPISTAARTQRRPPPELAWLPYLSGWHTHMTEYIAINIGVRGAPPSQYGGRSRLSPPSSVPPLCWPLADRHQVSQTVNQTQTQAQSAAINPSPLLTWNAS